MELVPKIIFQQHKNIFCRFTKYMNISIILFYTVQQIIIKTALAKLNAFVPFPKCTIYTQNDIFQATFHYPNFHFFNFHKTEMSFFCVCRYGT